VQPFACNDPAAPATMAFPAPAHVYRAPGSYGVTVTVTTAACNPYDNDWGPQHPSDVHLVAVVS